MCVRVCACLCVFVCTTLSVCVCVLCVCVCALVYVYQSQSGLCDGSKTRRAGHDSKFTDVRFTLDASRLVASAQQTLNWPLRHTGYVMRQVLCVHNGLLSMRGNATPQPGSRCKRRVHAPVNGRSMRPNLARERNLSRSVDSDTCRIGSRVGVNTISVGGRTEDSGTCVVSCLGSTATVFFSAQGPSLNTQVSCAASLCESRRVRVTCGFPTGINHAD